MLRWLAALLLATCAFSAAAQETAVVAGRVTDAVTGEPLAGASVVVGARGQAADGEGRFRLSVLVGERDVEVGFVGYVVYRTVVEVRADTTLDIGLWRDETLGEVVVTASDAPARPEDTPQMGEAILTGADVQALPAFMGEPDALKAVQLTPGVRAGQDGTAGLYVRGGSPDQTLMLLDGTPLYNASHLFGFVSTFHADAVESVALTKGAYPARYGGRLGAVLDVTTRDGDADRLSVQGRLGLLSASVLAEGPLGAEATFLVSARRSYLDVLARPFIDAENERAAKNGESQLDPSVYFYDLNARLAWQPSPRDHVALTLYRGGDAFDFLSIDPTDEGLEDVYAGDIGWGNAVGSLRARRVWSPEAAGTLTASASDYAFGVGVTVEEDRGSPEALAAQAEYRSAIRDLALRADVDLLPAPNHALRVGASVAAHRFTPGALSLTGEIGELNAEIDTLFGAQPTGAWSARIYAEDRWSLGPLALDLGLHASAYVSGRFRYPSLEPRASASLRLARGLALKGSAAITQQTVHLLTSAAGIGLPADLWVPADSIGPQRGRQAALGLAGSSRSGRLTWTLEAYARQMRGLLAYREGASFTTPFENWQDLVVTGSGRSRGVEAFVQYRSPRATTWVGYTLSSSDRQFDALNDGARFPYRYDRRHDVSAVGLVRLSRRWDASAVFVYGSGDAVTLPSASYDATDFRVGSVDYWAATHAESVEETAYGARNGFRLPPTSRLDLGVTYFFRRGERPHALALHVYNALNGKTPFATLLQNREDEATGLSRQQLVGVSLFPVLPSLSYRVAF